MCEITKKVYELLTKYCEKFGTYRIAGNLDKDITEDICLLGYIDKENVGNVSKEFREAASEELGVTVYVCITCDKKIYDETCDELSLEELVVR